MFVVVAAFVVVLLVVLRISLYLGIFGYLITLGVLVVFWVYFGFCCFQIKLLRLRYLWQFGYVWLGIAVITACFDVILIYFGGLLTFLRGLLRFVILLNFGGFIAILAVQDAQIGCSGGVGVLCGIFGNCVILYLTLQGGGFAGFMQIIQV